MLHSFPRHSPAPDRRQQHGGSWRGAKRESKVVRKDRVPLALDTSKLKPGDAVRGWISSVSKMGAFGECDTTFTGTENAR